MQKETKIHEIEIEAHSQVSYTFNHHLGKFTAGNVMRNESNKALSTDDLKTLIAYNASSRKVSVMPHTIYWGKSTKGINITRIEHHKSGKIQHQGKGALTINPGISIGRLRVINKYNNNLLINSDEIIVLTDLESDIVPLISKARGLILNKDPNPETKHIIKKVGLPALIIDNKNLLYSSGDFVTLNATNGSVTKGSALIT